MSLELESDLQHLYKNIPDIIVEILKNRNLITLQDWDKVFRPKLTDLRSPLSLDGMDVLIQRLLDAYLNSQGLLIYGDFDLDGSSGAALLYSGFKSLGFNNLFVIQPKRLEDGYGLHSHIIERYKEKIKVVLTVDVGITALEACEYARQNGIDVLITDHHLPKENLPNAYAIVNPNKGFCGSQLNHLCGAGVGYYVFLALWMRLKNEISVNQNLFTSDQILKIKSIDPKFLLDFFVIGTITDLVPLIHENRVLVKHGFKVLEKTERKGLKALIHKLGLSGRSLGAQDIGFKLAPKLNSLSRMDKGLLPIDVFLCEDEGQAQRMVEQILSLNSDRLNLQKSAETLAMDLAFDSDEPYIFVFHKSFHKGVLGLVATKLAQAYKKPTFVGSIKEGVITGSARLPEGSLFNLVQIMEKCSSLTVFGGHAQAAGFELDQDNAILFESELKNYFENFDENPLSTDPEDLVLEPKYDAQVNPENLDLPLMNWIKKLEPFGVGFELPVFKIIGVQISSLRELQGGHIKFRAQGGLDFIWFSCPKSLRELEDLQNRSVTVYGTIDVNEYLGKKTLQVLIQGLK